ncbi:phosphotransferase family protein [Micromonospora krabiensis]|uniref:Predicted kinase, aminoglycoside phosphotransferase (APT) family n=1 Tax=Micromonospora krabiensis TaxID=307121 RepID=A0A1C3NC23_9ACTN|nr:phosphotransferase [Micromonospora krabiensis]SBV30152.1 Predicted kinase, aminoglycoside phosphotransferase (APT) family [Micromonospora krabiensis]
MPVPPPPYHATAARPAWAALPVGVRAAVAARLGAPVTEARVAGAGFTRGFAAVLSTADGGSAFVKAAGRVEQPRLVDWYAREAAVLARLPTGLPVPRLRWTLDAAGWHVICLDAVDGRTPGLPWAPAELDATLAGYAELAAALTDPPADLLALDPPRLARLAREDILWWGEVAAGREPTPALPGTLASRLPDLVTLESRLPEYADAAPPNALIHGDLRLDNVLVDREGHAWFCDWAWLTRGPAWFDLAGLLITAYASGLDADRLFAEHPAAAGAPTDALDATLAALAGYFLTSAAAAPPTASATIRQHHRWSGEQALAWLATRQGWS